jgi:hypothetical protein|tara:strand:+ start:471 stop:791 length:321 start_codon:yes stop_codon:yes gene_type:complete
MAEKAKSDVRTAIEWAWMNYDKCVVRDDKNIAIAIDFEKSLTDPPAGGKQFLDLAFTNKVAFYKDFVMKALGTDIDSEDEIADKERKSLDELTKLLKKYEAASSKK